MGRVHIEQKNSWSKKVERDQESVVQLFLSKNTQMIATKHRVDSNFKIQNYLLDIHI